jgi:hypothetical protein
MRDPSFVLTRRRPFSASRVLSRRRSRVRVSSLPFRLAGISRRRRRVRPAQPRKWQRRGSGPIVPVRRSVDALDVIGDLHGQPTRAGDTTTRKSRNSASGGCRHGERHRIAVRICDERYPLAPRYVLRIAEYGNPAARIEASAPSTSSTYTKRSNRGPSPMLLPIISCGDDSWTIPRSASSRRRPHKQVRLPTGTGSASPSRAVRRS